MKYGIFADVHANLEALNTVLEFFISEKVDRYLCAGDVVGYGPNPNECVTAIRNLSPLSLVVGNHDWAACGLKDITWFNEYAQHSVTWTRQLLTQENQIYLSELPKVLHHGDFTLVHGSPRDPLDEYLLTKEQFTENQSFLTTPYTFVGHSHIPLVFAQGTVHLFRDSDTVLLDPAKGRSIINPGSVGQPRDSNSKASCALYDTQTHVLRVIRLEYDIATTQEKMRRARLPGFLVERLSWGK